MSNSNLQFNVYTFNNNEQSDKSIHNISKIIKSHSYLFQLTNYINKMRSEEIIEMENEHFNSFISYSNCKTLYFIPNFYINNIDDYDKKILKIESDHLCVKELKNNEEKEEEINEEIDIKEWINIGVDEIILTDIVNYHKISSKYYILTDYNAIYIIHKSLYFDSVHYLYIFELKSYSEIPKFIIHNLKHCILSNISRVIISFMNNNTNCIFNYPPSIVYDILNNSNYYTVRHEEINIPFWCCYNKFLSISENDKKNKSFFSLSTDDNSKWISFQTQQKLNEEYENNIIVLQHIIAMKNLVRNCQIWYYSIDQKCFYICSNNRVSSYYFYELPSKLISKMKSPVIFALQSYIDNIHKSNTLSLLQLNKPFKHLTTNTSNNIHYSFNILYNNLSLPYPLNISLRDLGGSNDNGLIENKAKYMKKVNDCIELKEHYEKFLHELMEDHNSMFSLPNYTTIFQSYSTFIGEKMLPLNMIIQRNSVFKSRIITELFHSDNFCEEVKRCRTVCIIIIIYRNCKKYCF